MAPSESTHNFRKLKIDTQPSDSTPSSPFASIKRDGSQHDDRPASPQEEPGSYWDPNYSAATSGLNHPFGRRRVRQHLDDTELRGYGAHNDVEREGTAVADFQEQPDTPQFRPNRPRGTSIAFDPEVKLDSGRRVGLYEPLPRVGRLEHTIQFPLSSGQRSADEASHHRSNSESEKDLFSPGTGRRREQGQARPHPFHAGEARHPLLQSTVDDLAREAELSDAEKVASLTSASTVSPSVEEIRTPVENPDEFLLSPPRISSPIDLPPAYSRSSSFRSRRPEGRPGDSLRKNSRRSTGRSGSSARSPASAFLSQWGKEEAAAITEPDDEGQEIGDHSEYIIGRQIGFGGFSVIKEAFTIENDERVRRAVKIVRKQVAGKSESENEKVQSEFEHEVYIWRFLRHRHILPLIAVFDSPFATFCITRLNTGGTLFDAVRASRKSSTNVNDAGPTGIPIHLAKRYITQLASALRYLHNDVHIVHRDIKLENCLLDMSSPSSKLIGGNVLLCDFGMADFVTNEHRISSPPTRSASPSRPSSPAHDGHLTLPANHSNNKLGPSETGTTYVDGSLPYAAPELLTSPSPIYATSTDVYALGIVLYTLLVGALPFNHSFQPTLAMMIQRGDWDVGAVTRAVARSKEDGDVKSEARDAIDLLGGCLEKDVRKRWQIGDVLSWRWLRSTREGLLREMRDRGEEVGAIAYGGSVL